MAVHDIVPMGLRSDHPDLRIYTAASLSTSARPTEFANGVVGGTTQPSPCERPNRGERFWDAEAAIAELNQMLPSKVNLTRERFVQLYPHIAALLTEGVEPSAIYNKLTDLGFEISYRTFVRWLTAEVIRARDRKTEVPADEAARTSTSASPCGKPTAMPRSQE